MQQKEGRRLGGRPIHDRHEPLVAEGCPRIRHPRDEHRDRRGQGARGVDGGFARGGVKRLARVVRIGGVVLVDRRRHDRDMSLRGKRTDMTQDREDGCYDEEQPEHLPGHGGRVHAVLRVVNPPPAPSTPGTERSPRQRFLHQCAADPAPAQVRVEVEAAVLRARPDRRRRRDRRQGEADLPGLQRRSVAPVPEAQDVLVHELGDVLWYVNAIAVKLGRSLEDAARVSRASRTAATRLDGSGVMPRTVLMESFHHPR